MSLVPGHDESDDRASNVFRTRGNSECVMLFDPTQLFRGSHARYHSFDSETMSLDSVTLMGAYDSFEGGEAGDDGDEAASCCYPLAHEQAYIVETPEQVHIVETDEPQQQEKPKRVSAKGKDVQEQLWRQLLNLQVSTEQAYQLTMKTTDKHLQEIPKQNKVHAQKK